MKRLQGAGRSIVLFGWLGLLVVTMVVMAALERQRLFSELQTEAAILHRLASQRADQHDAHLTSLSALAVAGEAERQDLFLDVAATIQRFYPRIVAVDLVPLDRPVRYVTTRPGLPDALAETIVASAEASEGELVLRSAPEANDRYLVVKRSPNTDAARFGLALTVDADRLLETDADFWTRSSVARSLSLPNGTVLFDTGPGDVEMQFSKALGSISQPLILNAGIAPRLTDLLPPGRVLAVVAAMTLLYLLAVLGLRQRVRTRRAEREARLSADDARLAHASRVNALGEMASGMAHELTQPLTAILSQAQAGRHLARRGDVDGSETSFGRVVEQAKRAAAILDRLRDWTRPQSERIEEVPINEAIGNVEALLRREVEKEGVKLTTNLSTTRDVVLRLDRIALEQIVFNLARNAVDAATDSSERRVRITSDLMETGIVVEIADSGPGVPENIRDRLFEPFVTGKPDGTGLGLALCQRLTDRMGGDLTLVEKRGETVFRLWLPGATAEKREAAE
ncbi:HAMP domain-containing sensor histidine kinase [Loktanella sp. DSM 29012]|uniref:sensor histidine kinase n=1 Tax=Loktanella sp. DSM 29012 TaxID=1881056 RepID=UPI00210BDB3B|nr:HAMP domain-containing sensor histidine kinase [Loktanella sp. DSM 29012]